MSLPVYPRLFLLVLVVILKSRGAARTYQLWLVLQYTNVLLHVCLY